jgi:uncharacterized integral membrane protein
MRSPIQKIAPWWLLAITGIGTIGLLGPYIILFLISMYRHATLSHLITLLFLWQTQTGATLAIVAAIIGGGFLLYQTTEARRLDQSQRVRKIYALRGLLTHDLAELTDYCRQSAQLFVSLFVFDPANPAGRPYIRAIGLNLSPPPPGVVGRVASLIENCEPEQIRPFVLLLERTQIQHARATNVKFRAALDNGVARTDIISCLVDISEIYARCSKLFRYARAEALSSVEITTADDVKQAVPPMLWGTDLSAVAEIQAAIDRRAGNVEEPWPAR